MFSVPTIFDPAVDAVVNPVPAAPHEIVIACGGGCEGVGFVLKARNQDAHPAKLARWPCQASLARPRDRHRRRRSGGGAVTSIPVALKKLEKLTANTPEFKAAAKVLKELISHHVEEKERNICAQVKKNFSDEQREEMNRAFLASKKKVKVA